MRSQRAEIFRRRNVLLIWFVAQLLSRSSGRIWYGIALDYLFILEKNLFAAIEPTISRRRLVLLQTFRSNRPFPLHHSLPFNDQSYSAITNSNALIQRFWISPYTPLRLRRFWTVHLVWSLSEPFMSRHCDALRGNIRDHRLPMRRYQSADEPIPLLISLSIFYST